MKTEQVNEISLESNVVIENDEQKKIAEEEKQKQKEKEKEVEMQQKQLKLEEEEEKKSLEKKLQKANEIIEEKRKEREAKEKEAEKERELQRRRTGQDLQNFKHRQQELELKELREERKRNKIEEQTVRKRILDQIAQDRAERTEKFIPTPTIEQQQQPTTSAAISDQQIPTPNYNSVRIQFKKPDGNAGLHTFTATDKFDIVREHVKTNILIGSGINNFALITTYPRREFKSEHDEKTLLELDLAPSAVILILPLNKSGSGKAATASIVSKASGTFSYLTYILSTLLSPVYFIYGYLKNLVTGNQQPNNNNVGAQKRANEDSMSPNDVYVYYKLNNYLLYFYMYYEILHF